MKIKKRDASFKVFFGKLDRLNLQTMSTAFFFLTGIHDAFAQQTGSLSFNLPSICSVGADLERLVLPSGRKGATASDDFTLTCNGANGATVTLETKNGGLIHSRLGNIALGYTAVLSSDAIVPLNGLPLSLIATGGSTPNAGDISALTLNPIQIALAQPVSPNAWITVTLDDRARRDGFYSDTLKININAN